MWCNLCDSLVVKKFHHMVDSVHRMCYTLGVSSADKVLVGDEQFHKEQIWQL